jgi:two-component system chemotaxis sensor kinase CheA
VDNEQYKKQFLAEAREYLQVLNNALLDFEQDTSSEETLAEMFRAAHSLKGMSSTMGYEQLSKLTHRLENYFDQLRNGSLKMDSSLSDLFFEALDLLEELLMKVDNPQETEVLTAKLLQRFAAWDQAQGQEIKSSSTSEHPSEYLSVPDGEWILEIKLRQGVQMKSVRAFMVMQKVNQIAELVATIPSRKAIDDERFDREFSLILAGEFSHEELIKTVEGISEIEKATIRPYHDSASEETEGASAQKNGAGSKGEGTRLAAAERYQESTVRVETTKLDNLVNLIGELVINRNRLLELARGKLGDELDEVLEQQDRYISALQEEVMELRTVPVKEIFNRFPRIIRDFNRSQEEKEIRLKMVGEETELDREIMYELAEPLVHLIRNACDHGLESKSRRTELGKEPVGSIKLEARREGSNVVISVADDGRGLDPEQIAQTALQKGLIELPELEKMNDTEKLNLIFCRGFSTAEKITDISGRGVGMDVVKQKIEQLRGKVEIESKINQGTVFRLYVPLTLAIIKAQLVKAHSQVYAIPLESIKENIYLEDYNIKEIRQGRVLTLRYELIPLLDLGRALGYQSSATKKSGPAVIVEGGGRKAALVVDQLLEQQEIVIKSFNSTLLKCREFSGATIMGDGRISPIIDVIGILQ